MFSGIVEETASVLEVKEGDKARSIHIRSQLGHVHTNIGDSIAVDGVCLTVTHKEQDGDSWVLHFDAGSETLRCTTLGKIGTGSRVHLERSLLVGERIHGHFVSGHVDCVATLSSTEDEGETRKMFFDLGEESPRLVAPKGSITIAGVSLTVGEVEDSTFSVYIIPHTSSVTRLGHLEEGAEVNIEFDMLARYVERLTS